MIDARKNMDEVFFRYFEGDLSKEEMHQVDMLIKQDSELQKEFLYWKSSYLTDPGLSYPNEEKLLRGSHFPKIWIFIASILFLGVAGWILYRANHPVPSNTPPINSQETSPAKQEDSKAHQPIDSIQKKQNLLHDRTPYTRALPPIPSKDFEKQSGEESTVEGIPIIQLDDAPDNSVNVAVTLDSVALKKNTIAPLADEPQSADTIKKKVRQKKNIFKDTKVIPLE